MKGIQYIVLGFLLSIGSITLAAPRDGMLVSHHESLRNVDFHTGSNDGVQKLSLAGPARLRFDALGKSFDIELETNDGLLSRKANEARRADVSLYKGRIAGNTDSWARITVFEGQPRGLVFDGEELYAIEAPGDSVLAIDDVVIYRLSDTLILPGTMACEAGAPSGNGADVFGKLTGSPDRAEAQAPGASMQLDLGAIGDFEFSEAMGSGAEAAILTRLNNVDVIFSEQMGVQLVVQELVVHTDAADPFSDTTVAVDLLDELGSHRQLTPSQALQGLTHLYTGRDLDGSTVGIAYTGALCSTRFGAGLSEGNRGATTDSLIAAHEIGHNFGAPHDGQAGSACESEPQTFLMAPNLNGNDQFSQCSIDEMTPHVQSAACIFPLPSTDMTIELDGQAPQPLLGGTVSMNFDATNLGSTEATNVEVDISIPSNYTFLSAASTVGSCTDGAGTVNCQLGTVGGGSSRTIALSTVANDTQPGTFVATVSADADDNPNNNTETVTVTALPAVDMSATAPSSTLIIDQGTNVRATIENLSTVSATNVQVSISLNDDLSVSSANWSAGSCTISGQAINCQAATFAPQSSSSLDLQVTGTQIGQRDYSVTLSSDEADSDTGNNNATGSLTINNVSTPPPPADDESGGGTTEPLFLWLLALAYALSRRRVR